MGTKCRRKCLGNLGNHRKGNKNYLKNFILEEKGFSLDLVQAVHKRFKRSLEGRDGAISKNVVKTVMSVAMINICFGFVPWLRPNLTQDRDSPYSVLMTLLHLYKT